MNDVIASYLDAKKNGGIEMANTVTAWPCEYDARANDGKPVIRARLLLGHGQEVIVNFNPETIPDFCYRLLHCHNIWEADTSE